MSLATCHLPCQYWGTIPHHIPLSVRACQSDMPLASLVSCCLTAHPILFGRSEAQMARGRDWSDSRGTC